MHEYVLEDDSSWNTFLGPEDRARLDPDLWLLASFLDIGDSEQVFRRTGLRVGADGTVLDKGILPLHLDLFLDEKERTAGDIAIAVQAVDGTIHLDGMEVEDFVSHPDATILEAGLSWNPGAATKGMGRSPLPGDAFRKTIASVVAHDGVRRVSIPSLLEPCLKEALHDIGLPGNRRFNNRLLDGHDVIVGIIDDGCALAHRNFLVPGPVAKSRIQFLWDQNARTFPPSWTKKAPGASSSVKYGAEIDNATINATLQAHATPSGLIDEDSVYEALGYEIALASHGTHVMDIAAGNGASMIGTEGVASASDLIFVQLPSRLVEEALPLLDHHILEAVRYIFTRANDLSKKRGASLPVVINISYGGYTGPHDGTSAASKGIDDQLSGFRDRAVVISAGNGYEAGCHARGIVNPGARPYPLQWNLSPEDPTANPIEIWYDENARLSVSLRPPGTSYVPAPVHLGHGGVLKQDGQIIGWLQNVRTGIGLPNVIRVWLNSTAGETTGPVTAAAGPSKKKPKLTAPCPSGAWIIELFNDLSKPAPFHAWIGRDDWRAGKVAAHQQSRFAPKDADPTSTIVDLATGHLTICVGAHNGRTSEICSYSAAGPTRDGRSKPDVTAPAEENATGKGILCASSGRSQPSWFNGTSASAPVVAGMVALIFQYNRDTGGAPLSPSDILQLLRQGAIAGTLVGNKRQDVDPRCLPGKAQSGHMPDITGAGKVAVPGSMP